MGHSIKGYLPILSGAKYLTIVNHILSYCNDLFHTCGAHCGNVYMKMSSRLMTLLLSCLLQYVPELVAISLRELDWTLGNFPQYADGSGAAEDILSTYIVRSVSCLPQPGLFKFFYIPVVPGLV